MDIFFEKLKTNENAEFQKNEKKWWNGHAYLPLYNYHLNYKHLSGKIKINYEFRQSEFSKPSAIDGGAFGDRHNYHIMCVIAVDKNYPSFSIDERGILAKLFKKQPAFLYKIKCSEIKMTKMLEQNQNLNDIYQIVENSPEFSPSIIGKMNDGNYELHIICNTQQKNENALNSMNEFCKSVVKYINQ